MKDFCDGYNYNMLKHKSFYGPTGAYQVTAPIWAYVTVTELLAKEYVKTGGRLWD